MCAGPSSYNVWQILAVFVPLAAIFVTAFGKDIRNWALPPKIEIAISPHIGVQVPGIAQKVNTGPENIVTIIQTPVDCWYVHLLVRNTSKWSPARNARVICYDIRKTDKSGTTVTKAYEVRIPLLWAHHDALGKVRTLFTSDLCDLCSINSKDLRLQLELWMANAAIVNNIGAGERIDFMLEFEYDERVAKGKWQGSIKWDGTFPKTKAEMEKSVTVEIAKVTQA